MFLRVYQNLETELVDVRLPEDARREGGEPLDRGLQVREEQVEPVIRSVLHILRVY
jgi:hypothetical protein